MQQLRKKWNTLMQLIRIYGGKAVTAVIFGVFRLLPYRKNRIVFSSFCGKSYSCNPRAIYEYLVKNYPGKFRYVWLFDYAQDPYIPKDALRGVRLAPVDSFRSSYYKATSGFWIFNHRNTSYYHKKKGQFYIQTWHGDIGFKGFDARVMTKEEYDTPYVRKCITDSSMLDAVIVGSEWGYQNMKASFFMQGGEYWKSGYPRSDILFHPEQQKDAIKNVRAYCGLPEDVKLCLYAPTFRRGFRIGDSMFREGTNGFREILRAHEKRFGGKWAVLFRVHPVCLAEEKTLGLDFGEGVIDVSDYGDMMDLMAACDTLITDYSSSSFEISLAEKPCWLLFDDFEQYKRTTAIVLDVRQVLFDKCKDLHALTEAIEQFDESAYRQNVQKMREIYGSHETGEACAFVAQRIMEHLENNK